MIVKAQHQAVPEKKKEKKRMNSRRFFSRMLAVLLCLVMIGTAVPMMVFAEAEEPAAAEAEAPAEAAVQEEKEEPKAEPVQEEPKEEPKAEPKQEEPKEEPKAEPAQEEPKEEPKQEEPKAEPKQEEPKAEPKKDKTEKDGQIAANAPSVPKLKAVTNKASAVEFEWKTVSGAAQYIIYRKVGSGSFQKLAKVSAPTVTYTDSTVKAGKEYTYTVKAQNASGTSKYNTKGLTITFVKAPKLVSAKSSGTAIKLTWEASKGADEYLVYRDTGSGSQYIGKTTKLTYSDTTFPKGTACKYKVRARASGSKSVASNAITTTYAEQAKISKFTYQKDGVKIEWKAVTGAAKYYVYRKSGDGDFLKIATETGTSYVDKTVVNNETHTFRIKAVDSSDEVMDNWDKTGVTLEYHPAPTLIDCVRQKEGGDNGSLLVTWEAVEHTGKYAVLRKYGSGGWKKIATVSGTSYTDKSMPSGTMCMYTVYCVDKSGNATSGYDTPGVGATSYMDKPKLVSAVFDDGKVVFTWKKVDKATNYQIYRKIKGEYTSFKPVTVVGSAVTTYDDTDVVNGKTYIYTVATSDGTDDMSLFDETGVSTTYYKVPVLKKVNNKTNGVEVTWNKVDGISKYHIYRKTGNGDWTAIGTSTTTSYLDKNVVSNGHYVYSVACMKDTKDVSAYDTTGKATQYFTVPVISSTSLTSTGIKITWGKVEGISDYRVFRKLSTSDTWTDIADVTGTSYTDTTAVSGKTYEYGVKCLKGSSIVTGLKSSGTVTYIDPPTPISVSSTTAGKAKVSWTAVSGAKTYQVYYMLSSGSGGWHNIKDIASDKTSYTVSGLTSKAYYVFRVYSVAKDGTRCAVYPNVEKQIK